MAYSSLSSYIQIAINWVVNGAAISTALPFQPANAGSTLSFKDSYTLGGNTAAEINSVAAGILTISASSSTTLNLQSLTDVLGSTGVTWVRIKEWVFALLSVAQDSVAGTAASAVVIQGGASNPNTLSLAGTTPTYTLVNGGQWGHADPSAGGITVSPSVENVKVANSDGVNAAAVAYALGGATS
jgi:hypothetical protein